MATATEIAALQNWLREYRVSAEMTLNYFIDLCFEDACKNDSNHVSALIRPPDYQDGCGRCLIQGFAQGSANQPASVRVGECFTKAQVASRRVRYAKSD